jgi:hypothetical protein
MRPETTPPMARPKIKAPAPSKMATMLVHVFTSVTARPPSLTVPRIFITKNPACRTWLGQCGIEVAAFHLADASAARLEERRSEDRMSVSCSPSDPVLITDAADLSVCEIYLDHIFR